MIKAITPDEKLWHTRLKIENQVSDRTKKVDDDGPGPTCCWHWCWGIGP